MKQLIKEILEDTARILRQVVWVTLAAGLYAQFLVLGAAVAYLDPALIALRPELIHAAKSFYYMVWLLILVHGVGWLFSVTLTITKYNKRQRR